MHFPERRRHPRVHLIAPVVITDGLRKHQGIIRNISLSGLGIESYEVIPVGKTFVFLFSPAGFMRFKIKGVIRWTLEFENRRIYGVEFVKPGLYNKIRLLRLIKKLMSKR